MAQPGHLPVVIREQRLLKDLYAGTDFVFVWPTRTDRTLSGQLRWPRHGTDRDGAAFFVRLPRSDTTVAARPKMSVSGYC